MTYRQAPQSYPIRAKYRSLKQYNRFGNWIWSCRWAETTSLKCGYQTGLLFIPHKIHEHRDPRWNNTDRKISWFVHQSSLTIPTAELSRSKADGTGRRIWWILLYEVSLFVFRRAFLTCSKLLRHGLTDFLPLRRKAYYGFLSPSAGI
jgi:hypothetical protein